MTCPFALFVDQRLRSAAAAAGLAVHPRVGARLGEQVGDDRPEQGRIVDRLGARPAHPALGDRQHLAGGLEHATRHAGRLLGRQPRGDRCDPCRRSSLALLVGLGCRAEVLGHARQRDRGDGVDGDAVARDLEREDLGEGGDPGLRRAVVGLARIAVDPRHRRGVDDPPADRLRRPWPAPASSRRRAGTGRTCP